MVDGVVLDALFVTLHEDIAENAEAVVSSIGAAKCDDITYPPGASLTNEEREAIRALSLLPAARSGLKKLIKDASASVCFSFFCILDGVAEPPEHVSGKRVYEGVWSGIALETKKADAPMLHDAFYDSYWTYVENT